MNNTAYFLSDVHLRIQVDDVERERRKELFLLMDLVKAEKATLFIVGDWFDFYFEYGYVVSQAYLDVYSKMKELVDAGITIYYFGGNHDYWIGSFLADTIGVKIYPKAATIEFAEKQFYFNHGDGLDPEDVGYHRLRSIIQHPLFIWAFRWLLHPNVTHWIANWLSRGSRKKYHKETSLDQLNLIRKNYSFAEDRFAEGADFVITGHIHYPKLKMFDKNTFLTIGDFLNYFSYGYFDGVLLILMLGLVIGSFTNCSSSKEATKAGIDEAYSDYRDGNKKALNNLISFYRDTSLPIEVRKEAMLKVIESNDPVGLQAIRNSLKDGSDLDYTLFQTGLQALGKTKDTENTKTILQAMAVSRKGYVTVRDEMFTIIEDQVDARSVALILKLYANATEDYASFLQNLTFTLGKMDDARVVPILMSIAKNKKIDISIRNLAVEILATKNDPAVARLMAEMLSNPSTQNEVKTYAISLMDEMKDERLLSSMIDALHNEQVTYYGMLDAITSALGNFDDPELKMALVKVARDDQMPSRFRKRAIASLAVYKDPVITNQLIDILGNPDNFIFYSDLRDLVASIDDPALQQKLQHVARTTQSKWERE